ncbi:hypothetical protein Y032_0428g1280 [Ancylostoma ceylanicum]|nr:hypothetical protein Y032_0428g1280 [Ancylostoma ceylanicum]
MSKSLLRLQNTNSQYTETCTAKLVVSPYLDILNCENMLQFYQTLLLFSFLYLIWNCYNANRLLLMCEDDQRLKAGEKSK